MPTSHHRPTRACLGFILFWTNKWVQSPPPPRVPAGGLRLLRSCSPHQALSLSLRRRRTTKPNRRTWYVLFFGIQIPHLRLYTFPLPACGPLLLELGPRKSALSNSMPKGIIVVSVLLRGWRWGGEQGWGTMSVVRGWRRCGF